MATLVRPPVLHVHAVSGGSGGGNKDRVAQRPWWGGNKPVSPRQPRQSGGSGARGGAGGGGALDQVLGVLRRDGEFLQAAAGAPLRDVFWLRFLEKKQRKQQQPRPKPKPLRQQQQEEVVVVDESPPAFPPPSYSAGSLPATRAHLNSTPFRAHRLADGHISPGFDRVVVRGANGGRLPGPQGVCR